MIKEMKKIKEPKNLFKVTLNDRTKIIVKSDPDTLEALFQANKIYEWTGVTVYKI